jgi:tetratricopeptide (TPR) repeat protein
MRWAACVVAGLALLIGGCVLTGEQERIRDYNEDGVFLFQRGDYAGARDSFQAATALKPEDPAIMYNLGECYEHLGNLPKAECYYRECLQRQPKNNSARHALVAVMIRTGRKSDAGTLVDLWLKEEPVSGDAYAEDGWLLHHTGDLPRAQARLHQALEVDPHNRLALAELALIYEGMQRPDRAVVLYERILEDNPQDRDITNRVNILLAKAPGRPHPD